MERDNVIQVKGESMVGKMKSMFSCDESFIWAENRKYLDNVDLWIFLCTKCIVSEE